eukprot:NODE_61_length_26588_cov_1.146778.p9 type:complete len:184 gc:universal NODE_61_length_26588_cov_1.146778:4923-4372(-)
MKVSHDLDFCTRARICRNLFAVLSQFIRNKCKLKESSPHLKSMWLIPLSFASCNSLNECIIQQNPTQVSSYLQNTDLDINQLGSNGYAALHYAAQGESITILDMVLNVPRIDINIHQLKHFKKHPGTPLHLAVRNTRIVAVFLLLQNGASTTIQDNHGKIPQDYTKLEFLRIWVKKTPVPIPE